MALDFPSSPADGAVYGNYTYNTAKGAWIITPTSSRVVTTSDTPPASPSNGDMWMYTVDGTCFIYYEDGTSGQWVEQSRNTVSASTYQSPNVIINSSFDIWQRGTSGTPTSAATRYVADRWETYRATYAAGLTVSRQTATDAALLPNIQYCMRIQRTAANATTGVISAAHALETINAVPLAGKTVTLSFYARAGANYSSASSALLVSVQTGTGTDQPLGAATPIGAFATGAAAPVSETATLTTSWQRFSYSGTIATSATQVGAVFTYTPVGTAGAADYFEITGVQLEQGGTATFFRRNAPSIQAELAACQRYYTRLSGSGNNTAYGYGMISSPTTSFQATFNLPVTMRVVPTAVDFLQLRVQNVGAAYAVSAAAISTARIGNTSLGIDLTIATGGTSGGFATVEGNGTAGSFIGFSAEL